MCNRNPPSLPLSGRGCPGWTRAGVFVVLAVIALVSAPGALAAQSVRIGVVVPRDEPQALERWGLTAHHLTGVLPAYQFELVGLSAEGADTAPRAVDFVLAAPADYAALEVRRSATRLLTLRALEHGIALGETAAVVLVRADRRDLQTLSDLKGKSVYASQRESFDGFWLAWRELRRAGVDPFRDFARLEFLGPDAFRIVGAVFDRTADAAIVRSATLGHAAIAGLVEDGTLRVLNAQRHEGFPYAASTPLYPEWAFARLPHTSDALAHRVTVALLQLPADSPAARASRSTGWTRALDYAPVHELLRELGLSPYAGADWTALPKWARQHWRVSLGVVGMVLALAALVLHSRRLTRRLRASEHKLLEIRAHLESSNAVLQQRSSIDGLTGVANRRVFDETLGAEWARAMRNATSLGVILVDIDFFKKHNDQYGHQAGDECLRIVAQTLCGAVKRSGDLVARYGGEEFAVILPQVDAKGAAAVAERMRARVEQVRLPHVGSVTGRDVTVSLGVAAAVPARGAAPHALVEAADQALYQAKAVGRNQVIVSDNTAAAA